MGMLTHFITVAMPFVMVDKMTRSMNNSVTKPIMTSRSASEAPIMCTASGRRLRKQAAMKKPALKPVKRCNCLEDQLYNNGRDPPIRETIIMAIE